MTSGNQSHPSLDSILLLLKEMRSSVKDVHEVLDRSCSHLKEMREGFERCGSRLDVLAAAIFANSVEVKQEIQIHDFPVNAATTAATTATTTTDSIEIQEDKLEICAPLLPLQPEAQLRIDLTLVEQLLIEEQAAITTSSSSEIRRLPVGLTCPETHGGGHGTRRTPPRRPHPLPHHQLPPPPHAIRPPTRRRLRFVRQRGKTRRGRLRHGARRAAIRAPDPPAARRRLQVATHRKTLSTSMAHARCSSNCVREMVELPDGGTQFEVMVPHPRSYLYMDLLALKKLDAMLLSMVGMYAGRKLSKSYVKLDAMLLSMFATYAGRELSKSYADVGLLSYVREMFDEMAEQDFISCSLMDIAAIRFTKPLLEEDMSSSSKGVCTITSYKIIAEKDDIVKAAMELKNAGIEDGYTAEVSSCRYALLVDVRDKLYLAVLQEFIMSLMADNLPMPFTDQFALPSVVVSPRGCEGELYCSQSCADSDWDSSHSFLSTGSKKEPSWRSALWIFVDILLVAAKAITYNTLRYKKLKTHRPSQDKHGEASCSIGFKTRWWECIALLDDVAFIGMLNTCHHAGIVDCGKEPEVAHVRLLFSEGFFLSSRVTKILCSEATVEQDQAAMRLLGASQLINHRVSDALSGLLLVEAILQYKG